mmetsp:Transcript_40591/g.94256  ORF Transcript_40591/g.94256 Transcript_40591/m.94256 type:complete len:145 (-) Transcript_40591:118-552(-)
MRKGGCRRWREAARPQGNQARAGTRRICVGNPSRVTSWDLHCRRLCPHAERLPADLADFAAAARTQFMGLWKMVTSNGSLLFPLIFGLLANALDSLDKATYLLQLLGVCAALWLWLMVPETCSGPGGSQESLMMDISPSRSGKL